jgi:hypothetical protein
MTRRPHTYGSEANCKAALTRYVGKADELIAQATGARKRIEAASDHPAGEIFAIAIEDEWAYDFRRWFKTARNGVAKYLQDEFPDALPILAAGLPPASGKPRHAVGLDNGEPWLREARDELAELRAQLGVRRDVAKPEPPGRFAELLASGLVEPAVIDDYANEMRAPRTPRQLANAIGAAKELMEATLRAALDRLGESYGRRDDLQALMRKWRGATAATAPPDPRGQDSLDKAEAGLSTLVTFLAEWRNSYGRGHGPKAYPPGLAPRHARLAVDAAETCVRFIATTLDDLALLPPSD